MYGIDYAFKTIGGETVIPSTKEAERIARENVKAAHKINPAKNYWAYWAKPLVKKPKQK